jgi:hypothetical protein
MRSRFGERRKRAPKLTAREAPRNYRTRCTAGLVETASFSGTARVAGFQHQGKLTFVKDTERLIAATDREQPGGRFLALRDSPNGVDLSALLLS